ncbi:predicted protein [Chaetoceros tenuissimus]|uniref:Uncharacterized protein n=1 Tax=Chaetoceros tenuissimus TaxID=426638 RepID=A0AAD3H668_9STRA|nr:predicted protein [Chaetoceros tenuissimus]
MKAKNESQTISRCENLQVKVAHLSVALQDKAETIDILLNAIDNNDTSIIKETEEINSKFVEELETIRLQSKAAEEALVLKQSKLLEEKKLIEEAIQEVLGKKQSLEAKLSVAQNEYKVKFEQKLVEMKDEWDRGREKREHEFLERKVQKIRKSTLEALQPQIQRLLEKQQIELDELKHEEESKMHSVEQEFEIENDELISEYKQASDRDLSLALTKRKSDWLEQISSLEDEYECKFVELRNDEDRCKNNFVYKELMKEQVILESKHDRAMEKLRRLRDERQSDLNKQYEEKHIELKQKLKDGVQDLKKEDDDVKHVWKQEHTCALNEDLQNRLSKLKRELEAQRDGCIEKELWAKQKEETQIDRNFEKERKALCKLKEVDLKGKIESLEEERNLKRNELTANFAAKRGIENDLQASKTRLDNARSRLEEGKIKIFEIKRRGRDKEEELRLRLLGLHTEYSQLKHKEANVHQEIKSLEAINNGQMRKMQLDCLEKSNQSKLERLESDVKLELRTLESKGTDLDLMIRVEEGKIEKLQEVLSTYLVNTKEEKSQYIRRRSSSKYDTK